jgi:hypothetical protein
MLTSLRKGRGTEDKKGHKVNQRALVTDLQLELQNKPIPPTGLKSYHRDLVIQRLLCGMAFYINKYKMTDLLNNHKPEQKALVHPYSLTYSFTRCRIGESYPSEVLKINFTAEKCRFRLCFCVVVLLLFAF